MEKKIWISAIIYGVDEYGEPTPRIMLPGDAGNEAVGSADEWFGDNYVMSRLAYANERFQGVVLVPGKLVDGVAYVVSPGGEDVRIGRLDEGGVPNRQNGSLPLVDKDGDICARFVDSEEAARKWAHLEGEFASVVIKNGDLDGHDFKNREAAVKDCQSYKMRRSAIDALNSMHMGESARPKGRQ